jgi:hypothetical protein
MLDALLKGNRAAAATPPSSMRGISLDGVLKTGATL